jgi:hypothetical protein
MVDYTKTKTESESIDDQKRRTILKSALSGIGISLGSSAVASNIPAADAQVQAANNYNEVNFSAEKKKSHSYTAPDNIYADQFKTELGGSFGYNLSQLSETGDWLHFFGAAIDSRHYHRNNAGSSWEPHEGIEEMQIEIKETGNSGNNPSLVTPEGGKDVGARPNPNDSIDVDYTDAIYTIVKYAITSIDTTTDAAALAADILNSAVSSPDGTYDNNQLYKWTYSDQPKNAHSYCMWLIKGSADTSECQASLRAYGGSGYNTWAQLTTDITVIDGSNDDGEIPEPSPWPTQTTTASTQEIDDSTVEGPVPDDHIVENVNRETMRKEGMKSPVTISADEVSNQITENDTNTKSEQVTVMRFPTEVELTTYSGYVE